MIKTIKAVWASDGKESVYSLIDNNMDIVKKIDQITDNLKRLESGTSQVEDYLDMGRVEFYTGEKPEKIEERVFYAKYSDMELIFDKLEIKVDPINGEISSYFKLNFYKKLLEYDTSIEFPVTIRVTGYKGNLQVTPTFEQKLLSTDDTVKITNQSYHGYHGVTLGSKINYKWEILDGSKESNIFWSTVQYGDCWELTEPSRGVIESHGNTKLSLWCRAHLLSDRVSTSTGRLDVYFSDDIYEIPRELESYGYFEVIMLNKNGKEEVYEVCEASVDTTKPYSRSEGRVWEATTSKYYDGIVDKVCKIRFKLVTEDRYIIGNSTLESSLILPEEKVGQ